MVQPALKTLKMPGVARPQSLAERIETDWPSVAADLDVMRRQLVTRAGVVANLTADEATLARFRPQLESLVGIENILWDGHLQFTHGSLLLDRFLFFYSYTSHSFTACRRAASLSGQVGMNSWLT